MAEAFARLARLLHAEQPRPLLLAKIVDAAPSVVPGCEHAGLMTVGQRGGIRTAAATDDIPRQVATIQYEAGVGPGLEALADHQTFRSDDLLTEQRWPKFSRRTAEEVGVRSVLSSGLYNGDHTQGALNLYSTKPNAFNIDAEAISAVLAAHASVALSSSGHREQIANLGTALQTSRHIGIALGIVMATHRLTEQEAFALLRSTSQGMNIKLRDIAAIVAEAGTLDPDVIHRLTKPSHSATGVPTLSIDS